MNTNVWPFKFNLDRNLFLHFFSKHFFLFDLMPESRESGVTKNATYVNYCQREEDSEQLKIKVALIWNRIFNVCCCF